MTLVTPPNSLNPVTIIFGGGSGDLLLFAQYYWPEGAPIWNGTVLPQMSVTDWITTNANYTVWTFHIKPGLTWSNGQNVTANDFLTSYGPKFEFNSTYDILGVGPEIKQEYASNSSTAVYVLNQSDARFADKLNIDGAGNVVFPASVIDKYGPAYPNLANTISMGPFYVGNYSQGQTEMTLYRNPYFKPQPHVCQVDVHFVESLSDTATDLLSGQADITPLEYSNAPSVLGHPNLGIIDEKSSQITDLNYNVTVYPFNTTAFRQALAYGINQSQIVQQAFGGYASTAYDSEGYVWSHDVMWYNHNIPTYSFNQTKALSLLSSMGIKRGSDGSLHYPNGTAVTLNVWTDSENTEDAIIAQIVKTNLGHMGIGVNLQITSEATIVGDITNNAQNIARTGIVLGTSIVGPDEFISQIIDPGWDTWEIAPIPNISWEWPPNVQNEYMSNYTAAISTDNRTLLTRYADNIQMINAQNLPTLILALPDSLWGYSTQRWTGWPVPPGEYFDYNIVLNPVAWDNLTPVGSASSSSTATSTQSLTQTSSSPSLTSTAVASSNATSSSALNATTYAIIGVIVLIIVVIGAVFFTRRGRSTTPHTSR